MEYELRTIDPDQDEEAFRAAYQWVLEKPDWYQYMDGVASQVNNTYSFENFMKAARNPKEVNLGLFNGRLQAVYTIHDQGDGSFQVHLSADKDVDHLAFLEGARRLREWLFANGARSVFGWLASVNRPMRKFAEEAGFAYCGVSVFKGSLSDRPIQWMRFQAVK